MLPSTHTSDVTKDRAILLYVILSEKSIDVGNLLFSSIIYSSRTSAAGLYYQSLITALCAKAGVQWNVGDELIQQM